jgi:hypothetical protein
VTILPFLIPCYVTFILSTLLIIIHPLHVFLSLLLSPYLLILSALSTVGPPGPARRAETDRIINFRFKKNLFFLECILHFSVEKFVTFLLRALLCVVSCKFQIMTLLLL